MGLIKGLRPFFFAYFWNASVTVTLKMAKQKGRLGIQGDPTDVTSVRRYSMGRGMQVVYDNPYNNAKQRGVRNKTFTNPNARSTQTKHKPGV